MKLYADDDKAETSADRFQQVMKSQFIPCDSTDWVATNAQNEAFFSLVVHRPSGTLFSSGAF